MGLIDITISQHLFRLWLGAKHVMAWYRRGGKPLPQALMTYVVQCRVTRPQLWPQHTVVLVWCILIQGSTYPTAWLPLANKTANWAKGFGQSFFLDQTWSGWRTAKVQKSSPADCSLFSFQFLLWTQNSGESLRWTAWMMSLITSTGKVAGGMTFWFGLVMPYGDR